MASRNGNLVSEEVQKKIRTITRSLSEERRRFIHTNEQEVKRREAELRRLERRQRRYIRLARKGFVMLAALARSTTMRRFFRAADRGFLFYRHGTSYSNASVAIYLFSDKICIRIIYGCPAPREEFRFPFNTQKKYEEFVSERIPFFERVNVRKDYDSDGFFENCDLSVLMDCADQKKFKGYFTDALEENR